MIQRLGDQMSDVAGFDRFLQTSDAELTKVVAKQEKRRKQMSKMNKQMNETDSNTNSGERISMGSNDTMVHRKGILYTESHIILAQTVYVLYI